MRHSRSLTGAQKAWTASARSSTRCWKLSVLEGEETGLDYSVFSVREMADAVIANGGYAIKAEIAIEISADLTFEADRQKISYVLDILLSNGISYSKPPKKIWITSYEGSFALPFHRLVDSGQWCRHHRGPA